MRSVAKYGYVLIDNAAHFPGLKILSSAKLTGASPGIRN